jgi:hypothetical protein
MPESPLKNIVAHWSKLVEDFQTSPKDFYMAVETALDHRGDGGRLGGRHSRRDHGWRSVSVAAAVVTALWSGGCGETVHLRILGDNAAVGSAVYIDGKLKGRLMSQPGKGALIVDEFVYGWRWPGQVAGDTVLPAEQEQSALGFMCRWGRHRIKFVTTDGDSLQETIDVQGGETVVLVSFRRREITAWLETG